MSNDLQQTFVELREDVMLEAEARGIFQQEAFFELYAEAASENGDTIDLEYAHDHRDGGSRPYRIDGHALDHDRGILHLAVCDFRTGAEIETLNSSQLDSSLKRVSNFVEKSLSSDFINSLEDTSPAFRAAYPIFTNQAVIKRLRVVLFSNARLTTRRSPQFAEEVARIPVVYSILDLTRYADIQQSRATPEPITVDIGAISGSPVPCLKASVDAEDHESYLLAIPGAVLAEVYGLYGARLLEQNVRTYLQARTKVNKGILQTIKDSPQMFFAYNNGLTATASGVTLERLADGQIGIASISNLQIVNGGQTTASILYAKDVSKLSLDRVHVQMKLSVVPANLIEKVVPKISRYANTQNRISEADFFSSHPFHLQMERYSRALTAPAQAGALRGSKWFYERTRGQYQDGMSYSTPAERIRYQLEFPKEKVIEKTDLAKFIMTFERRPDIVSKLAQKCFLFFAEETAKRWKESQTSFNEIWYRNACSMALLFRWTDRMIGRADWYAVSRGYKAQTVTYTLAWLTGRIVQSGKAGLNWQQIWNVQEVPDELADVIILLAPQVAEAIRKTPPNVADVSSYCKLQVCWEHISKMDFAVPDLPDHFMLEIDEGKHEKKSARATARIDSEIDLDIALLSIVPKAELVSRTAEVRGLLSPKSSAALAKLQREDINLSRAEKNAMKLLINRLDEEGAPIAEIG